MNKRPQAFLTTHTQILMEYTQKISKIGGKLVMNGWKTSLLVIWAPWPLLDVCQHTGSVYSALYVYMVFIR